MLEPDEGEVKVHFVRERGNWATQPLLGPGTESVREVARRIVYERVNVESVNSLECGLTSAATEEYSPPTGVQVVIPFTMHCTHSTLSRPL